MLTHCVYYNISPSVWPYANAADKDHHCESGNSFALRATANQETPLCQFKGYVKRPTVGSAFHSQSRSISIDRLLCQLNRVLSYSHLRLRTSITEPKSRLTPQTPTVCLSAVTKSQDFNNEAYINVCLAWGWREGFSPWGILYLFLSFFLFFF